MVVIPTYDGQIFLQSLVNKVQDYPANGHDILLIDTGTTDPYSLKILDDVENGKYPGVKTMKSKFGGYELGAIVTAIREFPDEEKFLFMHDSTVPKCADWVEQFENKLTPDVGAVAWIKFRPWQAYLSPYHLQYVHSVSSPDQDPNKPDSGIFGSIFMCHGDILRQIDKDGYIKNPIGNKVEAECWERIWSILIDKYGHKIDHIVPDFSRDDITHGLCPVLRKFFKGRQ
jgi:hypothetical protein